MVKDLPISDYRICRAKMAPLVDTCRSAGGIRWEERKWVWMTAPLVWDIDSYPALGGGAVSFSTAKIEPKRGKTHSFKPRLSVRQSHFKQMLTETDDTKKSYADFKIVRKRILWWHAPSWCA